MFARLIALAIATMFFAPASFAQTDDEAVCLYPSQATDAARVASCTKFIKTARAGLLVQAYTERGALKRAGGDNAGAIADLTAALAADDKAKASYDEVDKDLSSGRRAQALRERGAAREAMNNLPAALADYDAALTSRPDSLLVLLSHANLLTKLGRNEAAAADYRKALAHEQIGFDDELKAQAEAGLKAVGGAP